MRLLIRAQVGKHSFSYAKDRVPLLAESSLAIHSRISIFGIEIATRPGTSRRAFQAVQTDDVHNDARYLVKIHPGPWLCGLVFVFRLVSKQQLIL